MKSKFRYLILLIFLLLPVSLIVAQEPVSSLDTLYVAFWPDYDDPSVLILMTGTLPATASLPAEVTIPLPPGAEINAVGRIGEGGIMADVQYQVEGDTLTLTTPDPRFRVEFYAPYEEVGDLRAFDFAWDADLDVEEFIAEIQQPANAIRLTTQPAAANVRTGPLDGLAYHVLPSQSLPAGTPFEMSFRYDEAISGLTAGGSPQSAPGPAPSATDTANEASWISWLYIVATVALIVAINWLVAKRSSGSGKRRRSRIPAPKERSAQMRFCHNCGTQAGKGDVFCRSCGADLR